MYNHFFKETSILWMWGSVSHWAQWYNTYLLDEKKFTYIHDSTYSNWENIDTPSNAPYLSGGFVSPETMAHNPRCTVLLFEKQWFEGWPGCMLGPECRSTRLEVIGKEKFSDEGEKLWDGGQRKSTLTPRNLTSPGGHSRTSITCDTPLLFEVRSCGAEENSARQVEYHKELAGWFPLHHLTVKAPTQALRAFNAFYDLMSKYACKARIVRYLRTNFNWKTDANTSQWESLRRKRNNRSRK